MTEVAQAAVDVLDVEDIFDEINECENQDEEEKVPNEENEVNEENEANEENEENEANEENVENTEKTESAEIESKEDLKSQDTNEETISTESPESQVNGVEHKDSQAPIRKRERSRAVNGVSKSTEKENKNPDTNEDDVSEVTVKKEKLLRSRKPVARSYVPKENQEKGSVTNKFEAMQKAREERSRQRNSEEQQKRKDQFIKEREWNRRKQQVKDFTNATVHVPHDGMV